MINYLIINNHFINNLKQLIYNIYIYILFISLLIYLIFT